MKELNIAMAMLSQAGTYHLQHRTGDISIGAAGLVGCFGGKVEPGETPKQAIARELPEETNLTIKTEDLREIDSFDVVSDFKHEPIKVNVKVFEVLLPPGQSVVAKEGKLVTWGKDEIMSHQAELTPATKKFFERYFKNGD